MRRGHAAAGILAAVMMASAMMATGCQTAAGGGFTPMEGSETTTLTVEPVETSPLAEATELRLSPAEAPALESSPEAKAARVAEAEQKFFPHYAKRLALFLDDTPQREPGGIVFFGDSITEGFPVEAAFPGANAINRGISGDTILGIIPRLDVSVAALRPSRVYLLISINDIVGKPNEPINDMAASYAVMLRELRRAAPDAEIFVQSVLPLCRGFAQHNARVLVINEHIKRLAAAEGLPYVDLHAAMVNEQGELRSEFTSDGIHLSIEGYWAWIEVIVPPEKLFTAAKALAPLWIQRLGRSHTADKVDPSIEGAEYPGNRAADELIVYTPTSRRSTTMTNEWGCEAIVENGVVTAVGGNDSPIPANGFVVSGHGEAAQWVSGQLTPGTNVELQGREVLVTGEHSEPQTDFERRRERRQQAMWKLAEVLKHPSPDSDALGALERELLALQREARAAAAHR